MIDYRLLKKMRHEARLLTLAAFKRRLIESGELNLALMRRQIPENERAELIAKMAKPRQTRKINANS